MRSLTAFKKAVAVYLLFIFTAACVLCVLRGSRSSEPGMLQGQQPTQNYLLVRIYHIDHILKALYSACAQVRCRTAATLAITG